MDRIWTTISLVIVFFLFVSMLLQLDTLVMGLLAIAAAVALIAAYQVNRARGQLK